jgi:hypothetical protein
MFNCPQEFYQKYCTDKDKHQTKLTSLNLFSNLISVENLNLETGIQDDNNTTSTFDEASETANIKRKFEVTVKFKSLLRELFENFDAIAEELIDTILEKHCLQRASELRSKDEALYFAQSTLIPVIKDKVTARLFLDILAVAFKDIINSKLDLPLTLKAQGTLLKELSSKINNPDIHYMDIMLTRGKIEINANIALLLEHIFIGICKGE